MLDVVHVYKLKENIPRIHFKYVIKNVIEAVAG
jgi:hypothetical protein